MRVVFLIIIFCLITACERAQTAVDEGHSSVVALSPTPTPSSAPVAPAAPLKPVVPQVKFLAKEKAYLDESLPLQARKILEAAESFEVFAEINKDETSETDSRTFVPNRVVRITTEKQKKEILEAFYFDAAHEDAPAVCYEPHHSLTATANGKTVEIEICYSCSRFEVKGLATRFWGTIVREDRKSEDLLTRIIQESATDIN
jgi:hypothetical protein